MLKNLYNKHGKLCAALELYGRFVAPFHYMCCMWKGQAFMISVKLWPAYCIWCRMLKLVEKSRYLFHPVFQNNLMESHVLSINKAYLFWKTQHSGLPVITTSESTLGALTTIFTKCKVRKSTLSHRYTCFLMPWFSPSHNVFSVAKSIWRTILKYEWKLGNSLAKVNTIWLIKCEKAL